MLHFTSRIWALLSSLLLVNFGHAQIVSSSCAYNQSFYNKYSEGTWNTAYNYLNSLDSISLTLQPVIGQALHDDILARIAAVYNSNLPARDTVFSQLNITQFKPIDLLRFDLRLDTAHGWTNQFLTGNPAATSNSFVNALAQQYGFVVESYQYMPAWVLTHGAEARVRIASPHNTNAIARIIAMQAGVVTANAVSPSGDGNQIVYKKEGDYHVLTFRYGWEDCPAGCVYQRDWLFRVYQDCSVEFVTSYGDLLGTSAVEVVPAHDQFTVSPNPAQDWLNLTLADHAPAGTYQLRLMDMHGKLVYQEEIELQAGLNTPIQIYTLAEGSYFLQLQNERQTATQKVMICR